MKKILEFSALYIAIFALSSCVEQTTQKTTPSMVKCAEVVEYNADETTSSYPGKVTPQKDVNLSFRVAGVIERIEGREGDFVREGEVIAYMDDRDYVLQAQATQAEWEGVNGEVQRLIALYEDESLSQNDYEKATSGLRQITSKLEAHRNALQDTKLRAPFDGYVQRVNFQKGEAVSAGMPIIKFISASSPEVVVNIPAAEYLRHKSLRAARATINGGKGQEFDLERVGVAHLSNLNQLYECRFRVKSSDGEYPPLGVSAMVSLSYEDNTERRVKIPFSAVFQRKDKSYVWGMETDTLKLMPVEVVNILGDGMVVVKGDLAAGDMVVSAGVSRLEEGQRVEILPIQTESNVGNIL